MQYTRRKLLGGIGLGALGVGVGLRGRGRPQFTHYTYASSGDVDDGRLRVAWYERYNGRFQESQNGTTDRGFDATLDPDDGPAYVADASFVTDGTGPVVTVGNVLPGDEGTLVVGLEVVEGGEVVAEPLDVWLRTAVTADDENGINGPERAAGDATTGSGELDDELTVELWRDGSPLGTCNGRVEFDESLEGPIVPRAPVSAALGSGAAVGSADGVRVFDGLDPGRSRCVALAWAFPEPTATNRSQGDAVRFAIRFGGVPVGAASPFDPAPAEDA